MIIIVIAFLVITAGSSIDENENKDFLTGTWIISDAYGTEWKDDVGIIKPKAVDNDQKFWKLEFPD